MRISDLLRVLDELAPFSLAESWDNCGLLIGDESARTDRILVALELTEPVVEEAVTGGFQTIITHHPVFFAPVRRLVESDTKQKLVRSTVRAGLNVVACHTNLDSARGGLADVVAEALSLRNAIPLSMAHANWYKFVGFVPPDSVAAVADAVFAAGAGTIGDYDECAYATEGAGWFTPGVRANPTVGRKGQAERAVETRWETVVPRSLLEAVLRAFAAAHPYEEPAFDVYPLEDRMARVGLGRVGDLTSPCSVEDLALRAANAFGLQTPVIGGYVKSEVTRVAVVPGSGCSLLAEAARMADVLITGDVGYHDAETARDIGLAVIVLPHGEFEWGAMRRWAGVLGQHLPQREVSLVLSEAWRPPWTVARSEGSGGRSAIVPGARSSTGSAPLPDAVEASPLAVAGGTRAKAWIDGGSRGNPGPSAIGVVLEDEAGRVAEEIGYVIGMGTNNVAEYRALLKAFDMAEKHGFRELEIFSDSELLVRQMHGEYRVKNEALKELYAEARLRADGFARVEIRHVCREENIRADFLVNEALDVAAL